jgi:hypothetical protein
MATHVILDLDLDFFGWPPFRDEPRHDRLPSSEWQHIASEAVVENFLVQQCGLSQQKPLQGAEATEHEQAFNVWRQWLKDGTLCAPFEVVHVDAHSDLGSGLNRSCKFIETELLAFPLAARRDPSFGRKYLNSGNYLLGAIANQWIRQLTYVFPTRPRPTTVSALPWPTVVTAIDAYERPPVSDLPAWCFQNNDWKTGLIELKYYRPENHGVRTSPDRLEPPVPFKCVPFGDFSFSGFTHVFVAKSPQYTTVEADALLPTLRRYFRPF